MMTRSARWLGALVLVPLLTACALGPAKQVDPVTPAETPSTGVTDPSPAVRPATSEWQAVKGAPGSPASVSGPGLFLVDAETGQSEFWGALSGDNVRVFLSADSRYVWSVNESETRLADRESGKAYSWTVKERRLVGALADALLWEELDAQGEPTGSVRLERLDGSLIKALDLSQNRELKTGILRLNDQDQSAFLVGRDAGVDWRVDAKTGEVSDVARPTSQTKFYNPQTDRNVGAEVYQNTLPIVTVTKGGQPEYRIVAGYPSCGWGAFTPSPAWRADGNGLVVWSGDGPVMANLTAQRLESLAVKHVADGNSYWLDPIPSPTQNDRWGALAFSQGEVALASHGPGTKPIAAGAINWDLMGTTLDSSLPLWSPDGRFLQFQTFVGGGRDGFCMTEGIGEPFLPPLLQKAPFPAIVAAVSTGGDCLNLRAEPAKAARVLTCLEDGTRLTFLEKPQGGNDPYIGYYPGWALVRTEEGAEGWVNTEERYLRWAD